MRIPACILLMVALPASARGQEQTMFGGKIEHSGYGGPAIKISQIHGQSALLIGGRGGWILNHSLMLGGGGYGVVSEINAPEEALPLEGSLDIEFGYGGFEIEYIKNSNRLVHYNLYTLIGAGSNNFVKDVGDVRDSNEQSGESDFVFVLEPGVACEVNVTAGFRVNFAASYRLVNGVGQKELDDGDFSGPALGITFKFGKF